MLMKVHSYCSTNGELSEKALKLAACEVELTLLIVASGSQGDLELEAESAWEKAVAAGQTENLDTSIGKVTKLMDEFEPHLGTPTPPAVSRRSSVGVIRRRPRSEHQLRKNGDEEIEEGKELLSIIDVLTWSSNEKISKLAGEMSLLRDALTSKGVEKVQFPSNVTYYNYFDYLLVPSLVYELEFPRVQK